MGLTRKFGNFFLIISLLLMIVFVMSDLAGDTQYLLFLGGLALFLAALYLISRSKKDPEPSGRFKMARKMGGLFKKKDKDKEDD